jgi:hypothetical protein
LASGKEQMCSPVAAKMALHTYMMFGQINDHLSVIRDNLPK